LPKITALLKRYPYGLIYCVVQLLQYHLFMASRRFKAQADLIFAVSVFLAVPIIGAIGSLSIASHYMSSHPFSVALSIAINF